MSFSISLITLREMSGFVQVHNDYNVISGKLLLVIFTLPWLIISQESIVYHNAMANNMNDIHTPDTI